jgi:adenylate cyclase
MGRRVSGGSRSSGAPSFSEAALQDLKRRATQLVKSGQPDQAYAMIVREAGAEPADVGLRQVLALALARLARTEDARREALALLSKLRRQGADDVETLGIIARVHKDMALQVPLGAARREALRRAFRSYDAAYRRKRGEKDDYWLGVNAATLACLMGDQRRAARLGAEVARAARRAVASAEGSDRYWSLATMGEACLVQGREAEAAGWYGRARDVVGEEWAHLATTRRNLRLVLEGLDRPDRWPDFDAVLSVPPVAVVVGHMLDRPGRRTPRLPASALPALTREIRAWIDRKGVRVGCAGGAAGTDLAFLEALHRAGGETHLMLPYDGEEFVEDSVRPQGGEAWVRRFWRAHENAAEVHAAGRHRFEPGSPTYEYGNEFLEGIARLRARALDARIVRLAVWDGRPGDGPGGTAAMVRRWKEQHLPFDRIAPPGPARPRAPVAARAPGHPPAAGRGPRIVTALFGDTAGFSRLSHEGVGRFVRYALGAAAKAVRPFGGHVIERETWGDGLLFLFDDVEAAGRTAVSLARHSRETAWERYGLPAGMAIRIGLHTGPVEFARDPVTGRRRAFGAHLSHAARIEPVTPPDHVYASEPFAALSLVEGARGYDCTPVGAIDWAKGYARLPTYRVDGSR